MPFIRVSMWKGRTRLQKARIADRITSVLMDEAKCERDAVTVVFEEFDKGNWAKGGVPASR